MFVNQQVFEDSRPSLIRVYKVDKTLCDYIKLLELVMENLVTYLLDNGFQRGNIDMTLFIRRDKGDILLVQQKEDGIFISQDKYVAKILKKFGYSEVKAASTPMETHKPLLKDEDGEEVDVHLYSSMIGSLMYLTSLRHDIMFAVCACVRYPVNPKVSHLYAVKRILSDYARASLDRKSTTGDCQFLGCRLISWQCKKQTVVANSTTEAEYVAASSCYRQVLWIQNQLLDYRDSNEKKLIQMIKIHTDKNVADLLTKAFDVSRFQYLIASIGMEWKKLVWDGIGVNADEVVYKERDDKLVRAATTASILEAEQDSGNITKTRSKVTPNEPGSQGTSSGGGPRRQKTMGDTLAQTWFKNVSKTSNDSLLTGVNTPRSDEDSLKLKELMELCTNL
ncbi:hypothetical protein Tco_1087345 [Tanacetum coccineum]